MYQRNKKKSFALPVNEKETKTSAIKPLSFGLLLNSTYVEKWQAETIRLLLKDGHQLKMYVLNATTKEKLPIRKRLSSYPWNRLLFRIWFRFVFRPQAKQPEDIIEMLQHATSFQVGVITKGMGQYFADETIQEIRDLRLDFILRFGFNILRGDILKTAQWGIWSFHHDDEQLIRGGPPGFWEVYHKHLSNGVLLQQLTEELDKGLILDKAFFPVIHHSWKAHLNEIYSQSTYMPARVARILQRGQLHPAPSASAATVFKPPTNPIMLRYLLLMPWRRLQFHIKTLFFQEDWQIGLINAPLNDVIEQAEKWMPTVQWLPRKRLSTYLADPFVIDYQGDTLLFAEQFDYRIGKGKIVMAKKSENFACFRDVLEETFHLSFPYVFLYEQDLYCLPEQYTSNRLDLYKWNKYDEQFQFYRTLLSDVQSIDPVVFQQGAYWWLLSGSKKLPSSQLFAWHAPKLEGPYTPHVLNPIKTSVLSSRNAGKPIFKNGLIFRLSQNAAKTYGHFIQVNSLFISEQNFHEEAAGAIMANETSAYPEGVHTINGTASFTVIDGKRFIFTWAGFRHQLLLKTKKR